MQKKLRQKKCRACKELFTPFSSLAKACSVACSLKLINNEKAKEFNRETRRLKSEYRNSDLKIRKKAAKEACHAYIRERDKGNPCICCGRALGEKYDAGHFLESGNNSKLRYNEDNIHAQSVYCNRHQGGNSDDYEGRLRIKIGDDRVGFLLENKGGVVKRTVEDYREIEKKYKDKIKALNEGK